MGKRVFKSPFVGIDDKGQYPIVFDAKGNFSVFFKAHNPVLQYCGDVDEYYSFLQIFSNLIRSLDAGYALQKHDVFSKKNWNTIEQPTDFLMQKHFEQYFGRPYMFQTTMLVLTCQLKRSAFFTFDQRKYDDFINNVSKVLSAFNNYDIKVSVMTKREMINYIYCYFSMDFQNENGSFDNFSVKANGIELGNKRVICHSLIDIEYIEMPTFIKPFSLENINNRPFPHDLMRFLPYMECETIVYNQVVFTVSQSGEKAKLEAKKKRHTSIPDPANNLCVEDIEKAMDDIERNGQLLVYSHFDVIFVQQENTNRAVNQLESYLANISIRKSKQSFNQYELFRAAAPGNAFELKDYDLFLTTADVAVCLFYKEMISVSEKSNLMMWFTDRQGVPVSIDPSDLPMRKNRIDNRNKFVLGPSGSGKSFLMNTMLHQYLLNGSDVVMVDVGHSYKGLCDYYSGRYITYTEENPISMNPFFIRQIEYNVEKVDFLINLILLLWKDANSSVTVIETDIIRETIMSYYANYFAGQNEFTDEIAEQYKGKMIGEWEREEVHDEDCDTYDKLMVKIHKFIYQQRNFFKGEKDRVTVKELSFNSFYEFAKDRIPDICKGADLFYQNKKGEHNELSFNYAEFMKILQKFYMNGIFGHVLNNEIDRTLFDEQFVVFEIDSIQGNKTLFPIITLVIMDVFIQKMRNKVNRKVIVIEEAWKALASPLMADYIKYLYKTVRKFFGEAITVTQELDDIIKSPVVRESIIANAATFILCEQTKFKDNFATVAEILSLNDVEQNKIFTVNALDNKSNGRNRFKEFYIKRGNSGEVYGNEVSAHEYFTYTTEKPEKDAVQTYCNVYKQYRRALQAFVDDMIETKVEKSDFCTIINHVLIQSYIPKGISAFEKQVKSVFGKFRDSGLQAGIFLSNFDKRKNEENFVFSHVG